MAIKEYQVDSLSKYFAVLQKLEVDNSVLWFRGHAISDYTLQPSIYREPFSSELEEQFMGQFKAKGIKFFPASMSYYEWMFIMQHYGTPTRLLDWSESAMVAIAFATQYRTKTETKDATVWCLNPMKLNSLNNRVDDGQVVNICDDALLGESLKTPVSNPDYPVAILGEYNSERILVQKGVFTIFPKAKKSFILEDLPKAETFLTRIDIPAAKVPLIAQELYVAGFNELSLFPEVESISKEIIRVNS